MVTAPASRKLVCVCARVYV